MPRMDKTVFGVARGGNLPLPCTIPLEEYEAGSFKLDTHESTEHRQEKKEVEQTAWVRYVINDSIDLAFK